MPELSQSLEDYLEAIYICSNEKETVRVKDLSKFLKVKTPSVVGALKSLVKNGMVQHEHYGYIELTEKGREFGQQIYQKHQIIAQFFHKILGVDREISDRDACDLEHHIHPETYERIVRLFEFLENCTEEESSFLDNFHVFLESGEIPRSNRQGTERKSRKKLSELSAGGKGKIVRICANQQMRKHLLSLGVMRGECIEVSHCAAGGDSVECRIKEHSLCLKQSEAGSVMVEEIRP